MLKKILLGLVAVIALILLIGAFQSDTYVVQRSITINAPASAVFPEINDMHKAQVWSPWVKIDPAAKMTFDGPSSGVGASNSWAGNSQVGEGRQTIVVSTPNELVELKLEFLKPFQDVAVVDFRLTPAGPGTNVTWSMAGHKNYFSKVMCLFMSMDKMIGGYFDQGLATLKSVVETPAKK